MKALPGSQKSPARDSRVVGDADPEHPMSVIVVLRPGQAFDLSAHAVSGAPLTREQFAARFGADPADLVRVEEFASTRHLSVVDASLAQRMVTLRGRTADMQTAFGVTFKLYATPDDQRFRGREGEVFIPDELDGIVTAVLGLDDRPAARPHIRRLPAPTPQALLTLKPDAATPKAFDAAQVGQLYGFPGHLNGDGQCIALIELGGGYRMTDLQTYFGAGNVPPMASIGVAGGTNKPGVDTDADGEVALDIEVAGAIAPKAKIAVYFAPNTDAGFLKAIKTAIHDKVRTPSVISISWGGPEEAWTGASLTQFDAAFQEAAALGVTVLAASGDNGSSDGVHDGQPHVDFPASSPNVLACGGTRLVASGTVITSETVWNDGPHGPGAGGGGVSNVFAKPAFQKGLNVPPPPKPAGGRGVPDISGNADPYSGYKIVVDGSKSVIGGTSAVAPLYAGLVALLNQARVAAKGTPIQMIHRTIYASAGICRDVTKTNNDYEGGLGLYDAKSGWDACTGLGSAIGAKWLSAFASAHAPQPPAPQPHPQP